jgi:glycosyltransferase involved in cell wall biosynthesis
MVGREPLLDAETAPDALKILQVVASYYPAVRYGGTIVSVHGLAAALAARGHDVHVYTTSVDGERDSDVPHDQPVMLDGVHVWYFRSPNLRRLYRSPDLRAQLARTVADFHVVHTHAVFLWPLWVAARAATRAGVPYVVSPRGMLERDLIGEKSTLAKGLWIALVERRNLEQAAAIHVTSAREASEAAAFGFRLPPVHEIPNGAALDPPSGDVLSAPIAALAAGEPFVLFLGRLNWKKGIDRLMGAMARVPGVRLVVAGNDEDGYQSVLNEIAARVGVSSRVTFTGAVHGADKAALLAHARVLVLPSYSENFGNVVLEAMAAGCPVIVTPEVGIADAVRETGAGWVVKGDPIALGGAIARLVANPGMGAELGARGRAAAATRFSWDAIARQMEALYASVRTPHGAHR